MNNKFIFTIGLLLLIPYIIFSQEMTVEVAQNADNSAEWRIELELNLGKSIESGFLLVLPDSFQVVPISINIDNRPFYLVNDKNIPANDSVFSWQVTTDGIMFLHKAETIKAGDRVNLNFACSKPRNSMKNNSIGLREISVNANQIEISATETVRSNIQSLNNQ